MSIQQEKIFEAPLNVSNCIYDSKQTNLSNTWANIISPSSIMKYEENKENYPEDITVKFQNLMTDDQFENFDPELFLNKWHNSSQSNCTESSDVKKTNLKCQLDQDESTLEYLNDNLRQINLKFEENCQEVPTNLNLQYNNFKNILVPEKSDEYSNITNNSALSDEFLCKSDQKVPEEVKMSFQEINYAKLLSPNSNIICIPKQKKENNHNLVYEVPDVCTISQCYLFKTLDQNTENKNKSQFTPFSHVKNTTDNNSCDYLIQEQDPVLTSANFSINMLKLSESRQTNSIWHSPKINSSPNFHYADGLWSPCKDFSTNALFDAI
ncbi:uncharacterized protein LOC111614669 [Centruroides sculpturatus]|uniref:uncharacterized protein LOC111614669 n=1 Tax=Centruroides sculpturatus TaxID=218467 RepID=UPI000C6DD308|nr:uncharacterized protein LOC111614669 [Centruroides sculpturatus]